MPYSRFAFLLIFLFPLFLQAQSLPVINSFTVDKPALDYAAVEAGYEAANFSWDASGLRAGDRMQMHAWVGGQWGLIGEGFEPVKTDRLVIAHPLSFELPLYRLSIADSSGQIVAESFLELNYAAPDIVPIINYFQTRQFSVTPEQIQNDEGVAIHWQIYSRWHRSNLAFEQVMPDGTVIAIAENNPAEWRRATGEGILYPRYADDGEDITLRLRVYHIDTGETLAQDDWLVPVISDNSPAPELISFTVSPEVGQRGGTVTLSWDVRDAQRVFIGQYTPQYADVMCRKNGGYEADIIYEDLPNSGSMEVQIPETAYGRVRFQLVADRYYTGEYSCQPFPVLGEILFSLDTYNTSSSSSNYSSGIPSVALAGDSFTYTWSATSFDEAESVEIVTSINSYLSRDDDNNEVISDLPLTGSLEIRIPDSAELRARGYFAFGVYVIDTSGTAHYFIATSIRIDPEDNLTCASDLYVDDVTTRPSFAVGDEIVIHWDACGLEGLILQTETYGQSYDTIELSASSGTYVYRIPNAEAALKIGLYRIMDGQAIELDYTYVTVE